MIRRTVSKKLKAKVIYNPHAGSKRKLLTSKIPTLENIKDLLEQYQIPADYYPTQKPGHATQLAGESKQQGYRLVLAAGGDGTVSEVAQGLVKSGLTLGILPLGTYMNTAKMLSVPLNLEAAIAVIKIGRTRKIDVGKITSLNNEKLSAPFYFLENAGIGMEAELQAEILLLERGDYLQLWEIVKSLFQFYRHQATIKLDSQVLTVRASLVEISNGPWTGAALNIAPQAKLNDHRLTVSVFKMEKWELISFLSGLLLGRSARSRKIDRYHTKTVSVSTFRSRPVHADARIFGFTPISCQIIPNALNVISGFPRPHDRPALLSRTMLDPR